MIWAFIADSMVGSIDDVSLDSYQKVIVFCSDTEVVKFDCSKLPVYCTVEFVQCDLKSADSVVVNMAYQLGLSNATADKGIDFSVITNSRVFDPLCETIRANGRNCVRKALVSEEVDLKTATENVVSLIPLKLPNGRSRPRAESNLTGWIRNECESLIGKIDPTQIFQVMLDSGIIKKNVNGINYHLNNEVKL